MNVELRGSAEGDEIDRALKGRGNQTNLMMDERIPFSTGFDPFKSSINLYKWRVKAGSNGIVELKCSC